MQKLKRQTRVKGAVNTAVEVSRKRSLFSNTDCWFTLELPRQGGSNEYPQFMFWTKIRNKIGLPLHTPLLLV